MAIFNKDNGKKVTNNSSSNSTGGGMTLISNFTQIKGELETEELLHIDGVFEGEIKSSCEVEIGEEGKVLGNITAVDVFINGSVDGTIVADKVEIGELGRVAADIVSEFLTIQDGGLFEGKKKMKVNLVSFDENEPVKEQEQPTTLLENEE